MWMILLYGPIACLFCVMTGSILYNLRWVRRLPENKIETAIGCSIVIAARDEESRIRQCIERLLSQRGVDLEIIVVNDRSRDRTAAILSELAKTDSRLHVITVESLPPNWLGKCHACHLGASAASREWILFTDADCWLNDDVIARAIAAAEGANADHITLTPGVRGESFVAQAWHLAFLQTLAGWIAAVNTDAPKRYLGLGAFNLTRAEAYRACGGYEALRMTVLDDVKLGLLLRRAGKRTRAFLGGEDVLCHWGSTAREMVHVMEKNYFAALEYRTVAALIAGLGGMAVWALALAAVFFKNLFAWAAFLSLLSLAFPAAILARRLGWGIRAAFGVSFVYPLLFYAILNSTVKTLWRGGIHWRDTFYSLDELRRGNVQ